MKGPPTLGDLEAPGVEMQVGTSPGSRSSRVWDGTLTVPHHANQVRRDRDLPATHAGAQGSGLTTDLRV
jgi:hypothetical protein